MPCVIPGTPCGNCKGAALPVICPLGQGNPCPAAEPGIADCLYTCIDSGTIYTCPMKPAGAGAGGVLPVLAVLGVAGVLIFGAVELEVRQRRSAPPVAVRGYALRT